MRPLAFCCHKVAGNHRPEEAISFSCGVTTRPPKDTLLLRVAGGVKKQFGNMTKKAPFPAGKGACHVVPQEGPG